MPKCQSCNADVIHVRDDYTGATFPVNAEPRPTRGFTLRAPADGERNQRARYTEVMLHEPHAPNCPAAEQTDHEGGAP